MRATQQEYLQQRLGMFAEKVATAGLDIAVANMEALVKNANVIFHILAQDCLIKVLDQNLIQLPKRQSPAVVSLHELLYRQLVTVLQAPQVGNFTLVVEQQSVFFAVCNHVQCVAHLPHKISSRR